MKSLGFRANHWQVLAVFALSVFMSACGGGGGGSSDAGAPLSVVAVSSSVSTVAAGDGSVQLSAQITGSTNAVTWSVSPAGIGNLDTTSGPQVKYIPPQAGAVTADIPVVITATAGVSTKSVTITVRRSPGVALLAGDFERQLDGPVNIARHRHPGSAVFDSKGNMFVVNDGTVIRKITPDGTVSTFAGDFFKGDTKDGVGNDARFKQIIRLVIAPDDSLYVVDNIETLKSGRIESKYSIRKITPSGIVTTIVAPKNILDLRNIILTKDGSIIFNSVSYLDFEANKYATFFYRIKNGIVEELAGSYPIRMSVMSADTRKEYIYAIDYDNNNLVKLKFSDNSMQLQSVSKLLGDRVSRVRQMLVDSKDQIYLNNGYFIDRNLKVSAMFSTQWEGDVSLIRYQDGLFSTAKFSDISGIALDAADNLYVTEDWNGTVRKISVDRIVTTVSGYPYTGVKSGLAAESRFLSLSGLAVDASGNIFLSEPEYNAIRKLDKNGNVQIVAGGDISPKLANGSGVTARFNRPAGLFVGADGSLLITDTGNQAIRQLDMNQTVTTVAAIPNFSEDRRIIGNPLSVIQDKNRNIYVGRGHTIQKIGTDGQVTTAAGSFYFPRIIGQDDVGQAVRAGTYFDGYREEAELGNVSGMTFDSKGNLIFVDCDSRRVRKLTPDGNVTTIAGSMENRTGTTDGNGLKARFTCPKAITIDEADNLYVADSYINPKYVWPGYPYVADANYIRKITPQGDVTTLVGNGSVLTSVGKLPANLASPSALVYEKNSRSLLVTSGTALFRVVLP
ncbi:hypothetical protein [Undibacterium curvum]|uniref:hypothetical protein n=1 Tax=Undibacterium curvum TaxID=2762294 RepID=UPI003D1097C6